jgi:hypothetical protein
MTIRAVRGGVAALFVFCLTCPPSRGQDRATVEGTWEGLVIYDPAVFEVEQTIELFQDARGVLAGLIDVPIKPIEDEPLSAIRFDGRQISWALVRDSGTFRYEGTLSEDRNEISGQFLDRGKVYPFWLRRTDRPPGEPPRVEPVQPPLHTLSATGAELKERFNRDTGNVRLILLLSPG